jgi:hypothetical protein
MEPNRRQKSLSKLCENRMPKFGTIFAPCPHKTKQTNLFTMEDFEKYPDYNRNYVKHLPK